MSGGYFVRTYEQWRGVETTNEYGEVITEWQKLADISGRAYVGRMNDVFAAGAPAGIITWTFACPAGTDLQNGDQIRFDNRQLEVKANSITSRGDRIETLCQEVQT